MDVAGVLNVGAIEGAVFFADAEGAFEVANLTTFCVEEEGCCWVFCFGGDGEVTNYFIIFYHLQENRGNRGVGCRAKLGKMPVGGKGKGYL